MKLAWDSLGGEQVSAVAPGRLGDVGVVAVRTAHGRPRRQDRVHRVTLRDGRAIDKKVRPDPGREYGCQHLRFVRRHVGDRRGDRACFEPQHVEGNLIRRQPVTLLRFEVRPVHRSPLHDRRHDLAHVRAGTERPLFAQLRVGVRQARGRDTGLLAFALRDELAVDVGVLGGRGRQLGILVGRARLQGLETVDRGGQFPDGELQL